jgi:hypothetical protein
MNADKRRSFAEGILKPASNVVPSVAFLRNHSPTGLPRSSAFIGGWRTNFEK